MSTSAASAPGGGRLEDRVAVEVLCGLIGERATGKVEFSDGRKRWVFYLVEGRAEMSQSNLRSEQLKTLKESAQGADARELLQLQLTVRVMASSDLREGQWTFEPGVQPPKSRPADLLAACWQALQRRVPEALIEARLAPRMEDFPDLERGGLRPRDLPVGRALQDMLAQLDGQRTLGDVLDFAPVEADAARRGLLFAMLLGVVGYGDAATNTQIRVIHGGGVTDDEQDLISEMVASTLSAPPGEEPAAARPAPPAADPGAAHPLDPLADIGAFIAQEIGEPAPPPRGRQADPELARLQAELDRVGGAASEFEVLGVSWDASPEAYRQAYFALARDYHPDRWSTKSEAHGNLAADIMARVSQAWEILGEEDSRRAYIDRVIHGKKTEDELAMEKVQLIFAAEGEFKAAMKLFRAGRFSQAMPIFEGCVEKVPEEKTYAAYLGFCIFRTNHERDPAAAEGGIEMLKAAIDQGAKLHEGWTLLGQAYRIRGEDDMARRCFVQALRINPSQPDAYREMKRMQAEKDKREKKKGGLFSGLFGRGKK